MRGCEAKARACADACASCQCCACCCARVKHAPRNPVVAQENMDQPAMSLGFCCTARHAGTGFFPFDTTPLPSSCPRCSSGSSLGPRALGLCKPASRQPAQQNQAPNACTARSQRTSRRRPFVLALAPGRAAGGCCAPGGGPMVCTPPASTPGWAAAGKRACSATPPSCAVRLWPLMPSLESVCHLDADGVSSAKLSAGVTCRQSLVDTVRSQPLQPHSGCCSALGRRSCDAAEAPDLFLRLAPRLLA